MTNPNTKERLIDAMSVALRQYGFHGVGVAEVMNAAGANKGVLYHHFPGGKVELATAAIATMTARIVTDLDTVFSMHADPATALHAWVDRGERALSKSGYAMGCPLATVALETQPDDHALRAAVADAFAQLLRALTANLKRAGYEDARASSTATLLLTLYEGGLMLSRVAQSPAPLRSAVHTVMNLLEQSHHG